MNIQSVPIPKRVRKWLGRIKRKIYKTNAAFWYCKELTLNEIPMIKTNLKCTLEFDDFTEMVEWIKINSSNFPWIYVPEETKCAKAYNHYYSALKQENEIFGFTKIAVNVVYIADYEAETKLTDDEAFIYDTFILPEYRKKHLGSYMLIEIMNKLREKGYKYVYCHIPDWNIASRALYQGVGFKRIAYVKYIRILNFRFFSETPEKVKNRAKLIYAKS